MNSVIRVFFAILFLLFFQIDRLLASTEVDLELILAVDISRSMTDDELELQRQGYAEALKSEEVFQAISGGPLGQIALTYIEWGGTYYQRTIVDWQIVRTRQDLQQVAAQLTAGVSSALYRTSLSGIIDHATRSFEGNGYASFRQVVDISGDGPNNEGPPVLGARKVALDKGIVINGLPLMTRDGPGLLSELQDLDKYYEYCVTGGPGSFVIPVKEWRGFLGAVRKKLVLEIAGRVPEKNLLIKARYSGATAEGYDCLIGEKMWRDIIESIPPEVIIP